MHTILSSRRTTAGIPNSLYSSAQFESTLRAKGFAQKETRSCTQLRGVDTLAAARNDEEMIH